MSLDLLHAVHSFVGQDSFSPKITRFACKFFTLSDVLNSCATYQHNRRCCWLYGTFRYISVHSYYW